jgi:hypothetical protein
MDDLSRLGGMPPIRPVTNRAWGNRKKKRDNKDRDKEQDKKEAKDPPLNQGGSDPNVGNDPMGNESDELVFTPTGKQKKHRQAKLDVVI